MSTHTESKWSCDVCNKKLPTDANEVVVTTELSEDYLWSRIKLQFTHYEGRHNDSEERPADLCQKCAVKLLTEALAKVKKGERVSAGHSSVDALKFNQAF